MALGFLFVFVLYLRTSLVPLTGSCLLYVVDAGIVLVRC